MSTISPRRKPAHRTGSFATSPSRAEPTTTKPGSRVRRDRRRWHLAAALRWLCSAQSRQVASSWMTVASTTWIERRKRHASPRAWPSRNRGKLACRCSSTRQNNGSAIALSRTLFAWLSALRDGAVAPRNARSGVDHNCRPSHTSFRLSAWLNCAYSSASTWLHGLNVRARSSTPCSRASFGTRYAGISSTSCRRTVGFGRLGWWGCLVFFTTCLLAGKHTPTEPLSHHSCGTAVVSDHSPTKDDSAKQRAQPIDCALGPELVERASPRPCSEPGRSELEGDFLA